MSKTNHNKTYAKWFIIALLAAVAVLSLLLFKSCGKKQVAGTVTITKTDTLWKVYHDTIYTTPKLVKTVKPDNPKPEPTDDCYEVKTALWELTESYDAVNVFKDTIRTKYGELTLIDTVSQNVILGRSSVADLTVPVITNTVTNNTTLKPKRQVYIGGGLASVNKLEGMSINAGLLYKNRRDNILGLSVGVDNNGKVLYGMNAYWKIRLGK